MATYNIVKLKNLTPLHIGIGKENNYDFSSSELHSDTLTAALAALRAQQGKESDTEHFLNSFTLSSAFPFSGATYFLPKLKGKINVLVADKKEHEYRKQLKKLKYIESGIWNELVSGQQVDIKSFQLKGSFLVKDESFENPFQSQVNQRVAIPRSDGTDAAPFYFDWTYFRSDAGLYCITDAKGDLFDEIKILFDTLGETGIGTDRNVGGGKFEVETHTITLPDIADANYSLLLSLYIPTEEELPLLHLPDSQYEMILRGGYLAGSSEECFRHLRKKSIYMFNVGSQLFTTACLSGKVVNLAPQWNDERMHPVYRSGRPFYLPVKIGMI
jgi:CRISPR type III-A-associated RAMP protein Csm4